MYGGLFGDLPSTKKKSSDKETNGTNDTSAPSQQDKDAVKREDGATSQKKRPASVLSSLGTAGTSMAFVPTALRHRKRNNSVGDGGTAVKVPPSASFVAPSQVVVVEQPSMPETTVKDPDDISHIHQQSDSAQHAAPALEEEESEAIRQLHASVVDAYDPHVPNDLLAYWDRKAMERERLELEREARETLERQERLRQQLEQERQSIEKSGNLDDIVRHREQTSMGRGRGRGVSNLPAWLVQRQKDSVGAAPTTQVKIAASQCTVILSNLTAPGDVDDDLAEEVKEECEEHCGPVMNVFIKDAHPPSQPLVQVHVQFADEADAQRALQVFHGRKFGQRRITAELQS